MFLQKQNLLIKITIKINKITDNWTYTKVKNTKETFVLIVFGEVFLYYSVFDENTSKQI